MRIKMFAIIAYFSIMLVGGFSLVHIDIASASPKAAHQELQSPTVDLVAAANPRLTCTGTGEISGTHPGWISAKAISLTLVNIGTTIYGAYWCPAAAPNGEGFISYTLTSSPEGSTCETLRTQCSLSGISQKSKISIMATDQTGSYPIIGPAVQNSGALELCQENAKTCLISRYFETIPSYGNEGTDAIKSCTFAAVANWEHVVLGLVPDPAEIDAEFATSGGLDNGLTNDQVFSYWKEVGIGGVHLQEATPIYVDPLTVQTIVGSPKYKAIVAQLYLSNGQNLAGFTVTGPFYHWVVIDGFTPTGPLVMTWGLTLQMTWQQWNSEVVSAWRITVRS